jgi:hypothetical protein
LGDIGLVGYKLGGKNAGKPGGCEVRKLKSINSFMLPGFQASSLSVILASQPISLYGYYHTLVTNNNSAVAD